MGQVTIYLDEQTEKKMINMVQKSGLSKSKWIAELIREKTTTTWPVEVVEAIGTWKDFPTSAELRSGFGTDAEREAM